MRKPFVAALVMLGAIMAACSAELACDGRYQLERDFLVQPVWTRVERFRRYDLPDQYRIFRYGVDHREPPNIELAGPLAERGKAAVPFLLEQLTGKPDDKTVDDVLLIFEAMTRLHTYSVRADQSLMTTLTAKVTEMKDELLKTRAMKTLEYIKSLG
jgi:hypothetical protein